MEDIAVTDDLPARHLSLGRVVVLCAALMFLAGAVVYAVMARSDAAAPNEVDVGFLDDMQPHHLQGVQMALTYLEDGEDPFLRHTAEEIVLVQAGEVRLMGQALEDWGAPEVDASVAMDWMGMPVPQLAQPGMATDAQMAELEAAEGAELDEQFSRLMIEHHRGGAHMAEFAADHGDEALVERLAGAMVRTQTFEINELNTWRVEQGLSEV